jgi:type VI secretion system protein ImpF
MTADDDAMATLPDARDRLQPALLDRLTGGSRVGADDEQRFVTKAALRKAVIRDLGWLLNAVQPLPEAQALRYPQAARSVLNFGLPALAGQLASKIDVARLERAIRQAIIDFEPRVNGDTVTVTAIEAEDVLSTHNVIEFEIRGWLWAQPVPLELMLRTQLDLEAGKVELRDLSPGAAMHSTIDEAS